MTDNPDRLSAAVRAVFGTFVPASKIEALRAELERAGLIAGEAQTRAESRPRVLH